ncbi:MAG: gamma-aminobutyrate dehydratase [Acidobacteria bacterium]|nr:MAG: gamma-aminobutyrate dehydratase [Acidobacteriota bacterium]
MGLRTVEQYKTSLRDGRVVYFRGKRVEDVTTHPVIGIAVNHAAIDYEIAHQPEHRDLAVYVDLATGQEYSRYFKIPASTEDLLKRSELIETSTRLGGTLVVLIKEIGTDCLFALHLVAKQMDGKLGTTYFPRVRAIYEHCRSHDLAMAVAQTDVKGDRSRGPAEQEHPDYYVRVVDRRPGGIIVRGAKVHTSVTPNANELFVIPTRNLTQVDADYAVAFCIPLNTPGLKQIASPYGAGHDNAFTHPISSRHKMMETLTIFDDVFVPNERVFMNGEWQFAGALAKTFVEFHRFTAISYKLPLLDLLVGSALLIAEQNGIERAGHVREKLTWLISYAETVRMLTKMAAMHCTIEDGIVVPNTAAVNIAKLHFASNYHQALMHVQDLTGGLLVTGPGEEDLRNPETAKYIDHYLGGAAKVAGEQRLRTINLISDLTTGDFGGYQAVLAIHAEGSLEAEKLTILREYDQERAKKYARWMSEI